MGRHSVMLRPDSVRRVTPPTTMTPKTRREEKMSQPATGGGDRTGRAAAAACVAFLEKKRGSNGGRRVRWWRKVMGWVRVRKPVAARSDVLVLELVMLLWLKRREFDVYLKGSRRAEEAKFLDANENGRLKEHGLRKAIAALKRPPQPLSMQKKMRCTGEI